MQLTWMEGGKIRMKLSETQQKILKVLWTQSKTTQTEISERINVDKSTVSRNISKLFEYGILRKTGSLNPGPKGGRRMEIIEFNPGWRQLLGISVEQGELYAILTDFSGRAVREYSIFTKVEAENIVKKSLEVIEQLHASKDKLLGIALAVPGVVEPEEGAVIFSESLGMRNFPIKQMVEDELSVPCLVENDSNAAVARTFSWPSGLDGSTAYFLFSLPSDLSDLVGLGVGIGIEGKIFRGCHLLAGEVPIRVPICSRSLPLKALKESLESSSLDFSRFLEKASDILSNILNLLDPCIAMIGGDVNLLPKDVVQDLVILIQEKTYMLERKQLKIVCDFDGLKTPALGAVRAFLLRFMGDLEFANRVLSEVRDE